MSAYVKAPRGRSPLDSVKPYQRPRFAAPYTQRSELKASDNNALLVGMFVVSSILLVSAPSDRKAFGDYGGQCEGEDVHGR